MPGFDRTGPRGEGPMTGGGFGYCAGAIGAGTPRGYGGRGGFYGRGRGWRNRYWLTGQPLWARGAPSAYPASSRDADRQLLRERANWLEQELETVRQELDRLQQESDGSAE